ncbi:hypothetical protein BJ742DRAFT_108247 [Cladochytrium replicatum]|nr:hypothetical protein BJ742DRAFT_108247 [Cladochytrium replicatum]
MALFDIPDPLFSVSPPLALLVYRIVAVCLGFLIMLSVGLFIWRATLDPVVAQRSVTLTTIGSLGALIITVNSLVFHEGTNNIACLIYVLGNYVGFSCFLFAYLVKAIRASFLYEQNQMRILTREGMSRKPEESVWADSRPPITIDLPFPGSPLSPTPSMALPSDPITMQNLHAHYNYRRRATAGPDMMYQMQSNLFSRNRWHRRQISSSDESRSNRSMSVSSSMIARPSRTPPPNPDAADNYSRYAEPTEVSMRSDKPLLTLLTRTMEVEEEDDECFVGNGGVDTRENVRLFLMIFFGMMLLLMAYLLIVQVFTNSLRINGGTKTCDVVGLSLWENYFLYGLYGFHVVLGTPYTIYILWKASDSFGIRECLLVSVTSMQVAIFLFFGTEILLAQSSKIRTIWGASNWFVVAVLFSHVTAVILPVIKSIARSVSSRKTEKMIQRQMSVSIGQRARRYRTRQLGGNEIEKLLQEESRRSRVPPQSVEHLNSLGRVVRMGKNGVPIISQRLVFRAVLADPVCLESFKRFCVKDYTAENPLFWQEWINLIHSFLDSMRSLSSSPYSTPDSLTRPITKVPANVDKLINYYSSQYYRTVVCIAEKDPFSQLKDLPVPPNMPAYSGFVRFYKAFIAPDAPNQVNVSSGALQRVVDVFTAGSGGILRSSSASPMMQYPRNTGYVSAAKSGNRSKYVSLQPTVVTEGSTYVGSASLLAIPQPMKQPMPAILLGVFNEVRDEVLNNMYQTFRRFVVEGNRTEFEFCRERVVENLSRALASSSESR